MVLNVWFELMSKLLRVSLGSAFLDCKFRNEFF